MNTTITIVVTLKHEHPLRTGFADRLAAAAHDAATEHLKLNDEVDFEVDAYEGDTETEA
jgi:hypothetical protein